MAKATNPPAATHPVLTGSELLATVQNMEKASKEEKAKACGYWILTKDGKERINLLKFFKAFMEADEAQRRATGRNGRGASYRISVQKNGNLLVGSTYTQQMGLEPGDEVEIRLGRKHIQLCPILADAEDDFDDDEDEMDLDLEDDLDEEGAEG
ncbi:MAG: AbrB family transcriptional regulator [Oscillatoriales cyanobacterium SM2_1_8]|nr:AbrB family transcriptional regulator [Oscillatoriales cyanobacterium SM2_1_8]